MKEFDISEIVHQLERPFWTKFCDSGHCAKGWLDGSGVSRRLWPLLQRKGRQGCKFCKLCRGRPILKRRRKKIPKKIWQLQPKSYDSKYSNVPMQTFLRYTLRRNLLNWCNLVSISKKLRFYVFGVVRIY